MSIFSELRALVFLRRIAIAEERLAACAEARLEHDRKQWWLDEARNLKKLQPLKQTEFASFDVEAANEQWRREQEAAEYGGIPEESPSSSK